MIADDAISQAVNMLLDAAPPGSKVILFGSYARGRAGPDSDLDFLVVEPEVESEFDEMVRLGEVLRPLGVPTDVLVVSAETFRYWAETPNTVFYRAAREGKVYEQVG